MFGLPQFAMPLNENQIVAFQSKKLWTTVMLENVPQLALQILYLVIFDDSDSAGLVVYGSMLFSLLSIVSNTLTFCTQREIVNRMNSVSVQFDITSGCGRKQMNRIKELKRGMADILEIDGSLLDIARPRTIRKGLRMEIEIYVNPQKAKEMEIGEVIKKYIENGGIAKMIQSAWQLKVIPSVSNLKLADGSPTDESRGDGAGTEQQESKPRLTNEPV